MPPKNKKKGASRKKKTQVKKDVQRTLPIEQGPKESIRFTYFAACGSYPKKGYEKYPNQWWSTNHFGQQLWKEIDNSNRQYSQLGPAYKGTIPIEILLDMVQEEIMYGEDFQKIYQNWTFKYQIGNARYVNGRYETRVHQSGKNKGKPYQYYKADLITTVTRTIEKSRGTPPVEGFTIDQRIEYLREQGRPYEHLLGRSKRHRDENQQE